ncbi:MAG: hypothetical protein K2K80_04670 [Clostridia bacterium]|nr:hypothetical protein [Clostridia bacterium]
MPYREAKVYFDGSHYIAIPPENFPSSTRKRKKPKPPKPKQNENTPPTHKDKFETAYKESQQLPKRERKRYIKEKLKDEFKNAEQLKEFVAQNIERKKINAYKRNTRLWRKIYTQGEWHYFVTFTYDDKKLTEKQFKTKLRNALKHAVNRNGWKYIGVWERSPEKQRLHFHGIFYIPQMIGKITEVKDYSTKSHRMQTTYQNDHFLKEFGRNDFEKIEIPKNITQSVRYLLKYIEKSGEKLVYGGKLPTYFKSDILDEDIACGYGVDDKKLLLFDSFRCIDEGEILGNVSPEIIKKMPKCN